MRDLEMEERLRSLVEAQVPERLDNILALVAQRRQGREKAPLELEKARIWRAESEESAGGAQPGRSGWWQRWEAEFGDGYISQEEREHRKREREKRTGFSFFSAWQRPGCSFVLVDVNPSLSLAVDAEGKILAAGGLNEDGEALLAALELDGQELSQGIQQLVEELLERGYLSKWQNSILISVEGKDEAGGQILQQQVAGLIEMAMQGCCEGEPLSPAVFSQALVQEDEDLAALAGEYGISMGKAAFIQGVLEEDEPVQEPLEEDEEEASEELSFEELAQLTVNDIALLATSRGVRGGAVQYGGAVSAAACIGEREALRLALLLAKTELSLLKKHRVKLDCHKGRLVYEVKLKGRDGSFKCSLDAKSGELVTEKRKEKQKGSLLAEWAPRAAEEGRINMKKVYMTENAMAMGTMGSVPVPAGAIGEAAAKAAALAHAGVSENELLYVYVHPECNHGYMEHYDVKFVAGNMKYKYAIGLFDGAVLGRATKNKALKTGYVYEGNYHEHFAAPMGACMQAGAPVTSANPQLVQPVASQPVNPQPVTAEAQPAAAQGAQQAGGAVLGQVPVGAGAGALLSEAEALARVLEHAGLTTAGVQRWRIKLVSKHGRTVYKVKLKLQGLEYEYIVDGYTGMISKAHRELDF